MLFQAVLMAAFGWNAEPARAAVIQDIERWLAPYRDIYVETEGELRAISTAGGEDKLVLSTPVTASLLLQLRPTKLRIESFEQQSGGPTVRTVFTMSDGTWVENISSQHPHAPNVPARQPWNVAFIGRQTTYLKLFKLLEISMLASDLENTIDVEGPEPVDQEACPVLAVRTRSGASTCIRRYWLSPSHGHHPRKFEYLLNGVSWMRCDDIRFGRFSDSLSNQLWLPVAGTVVGTSGKHPRRGEEPIAVLESAVKINAFPPADRFKFSFKPEPLISAPAQALQRMFFQPRQEKRVSLSEADKVVAEQIKEAEAQGQLVTARSVESAAAWYDWLPYALAPAFALLLLAVAWRRGRP